MTKPLNQEIKALRAVNRALDSLPDGAMQRCLEWIVASRCGRTWINLPPATPATGDRSAVANQAPLSPLGEQRDGPEQKTGTAASASVAAQENQP